MTHPLVAATSDAEPVYGVFQLGAAQVALPLDALREVIPSPAQFAALPAAARGLLGAVDLRGRVLPVIDLRTVLGLPDERSAEAVVVVMRHSLPRAPRQGQRAESRLLGLLADGVRGITVPAAGALQDIRDLQDGLLFSGSFVRGEDGRVVSVLDPAAVLRLPSVPVLREQGELDRSSVSAARQVVATRRPRMLVRCGNIGLSMSVTDIHTTLPRVNLRPSCMGGRICRGVVEHGGMALPAVDPLALLGLGTLPADEPCEALLLRFEAGLVALLVSQVVDIVHVADVEMLALPTVALSRPDMFCALVQVAGRGDHLMLSPGALHHDAELRLLATMNTPIAGTVAVAALAQNAPVPGRSVITFDIGAEVAAPVTDVREIVALPPARSRTDSPHAAAIGLFTHRREVVTLWCLATLLGRPSQADEPGARVLLVDADNAVFGFVVPRLCNIETTAWQQAPTGPSTALGAGSPRPFSAYPLIEVGVPPLRRTLPLLDLPGLARALMDESAERAASGPVSAPGRPVLTATGVGSQEPALTA